MSNGSEQAMQKSHLMLAISAMCWLNISNVSQAQTLPAPSGCVQELVASMASNHACQRIENYYALRSKMPNNMVKVIETGDASAYHISYATRDGNPICGGLWFTSVTQIDNATEQVGKTALGVARELDAGVNENDEEIREWAFAVADDFIARGRGEHVPERSAKELVAVVALFKPRLTAALAFANSTAPSRRCTIGVGTVMIQMPRALPANPLRTGNPEALTLRNKLNEWLSKLSF
jgi:hypothetical protein